MTDSPTRAAVWRAACQEQFLEVASRDEAEARFQHHLRFDLPEPETVPLGQSLQRVLACDVVAALDVPGFDRSSMDGFAVRAADTSGAREDAPCRLRLNPEILTPGVVPTCVVEAGTATVIATGGMLPRGADAVVMIEHTEAVADGAATGIMRVDILRPVAPGQATAAAGSDIARGETLLREGQVLSSREIGMLAAIGLAEIQVWRRPRVAILSTGDEIVPPGQPLAPGQVYDSNAAILAAAVTECGGEPVPLGIAPDHEEALQALLARALAGCEMVLLSGGTSKGAGDIAAKVVGRLQDPGIVVHGVALKPGKPLCLAVSGGKGVVILPGFPTSAIFTFHEFVAPVITRLARRPPTSLRTTRATLAVRVGSEAGRTEYVMTSLVRAADGRLAAYPAGKGSGAVTAFSQADGFFSIPALREGMAAGSEVEVRILGETTEPADLVIIGSHCIGLDLLIGRLMKQGVRIKALNVGSSGGLAAARRGECDLAGIHLLDPVSGHYNRPFLSDGLELIEGYGRRQGLVFRQGDLRFVDGSGEIALAAVLADPNCLMVNRNAGSGTRVVIDRMLGSARPSGYLFQARSHNAVAAAVAQRRADWGIAIEAVSRSYGLGFLPVQAERYDFVVPSARKELAPVRRFLAVLQSESFRKELELHGFDTGTAV